MKRKSILLTASGLAVAMMCSPVFAQDTATTTAAPPADDTVVVVKGIRKALQTAADRKRKSSQIVDSVDAEDAGKLPDNNVNEAIARITGVQIERARGEGSGLKIRGMEDVQTTLNGAPNNTGVGRSASLNDIPAELLKSVQIYKNRTADQVEGGIAGTVNVDLRRPFDLPKGWTLAGSVRNVYADVGSTESPYASALIAKRWDTPIGEIGFLANLSYQKNNYKEQWVTSESPDGFWGAQIDSLPAADKGAIAAYKIQNGIESGSVERNSYNVALQWRATDNLDFLLEASGFNADENRSTDFLEARLKDSVGTLSNITYMPDGVTLKSATQTDPNMADGAILPVGPFARDNVITTRNSRVNFEAHYNKERWTTNFSAYTDENRLDLDWYQQMLRMDGLATVKYDFASDKMAEPGPTLAFFDAAGNPLDFNNINNYYVREIENGKGYEYSKETVFAFDTTYRVSDDKLIRSVQVGARKSHRDAERLYGYRYAGFEGAKAIKLANFPGGSGLTDVYADVPGFDSLHWKRLSLDSYLANFDAIRGLASNSATLSYGGGGAWDPVTGFVPATQQWSTPGVQTERMMGTFTTDENTAALFAQVFYGFDVAGIPVDGVIGARQVHTWGTSFSYNRVINWIDNDNNPATPNVIGTPDQIMVPAPFEGDYKDFMPSAHAVVHFTPKLQLRVAYSLNVQRPRFDQATSFTFLDSGASGIGNGWGGNADLKANKETNWDTSLEYYFGRGGVVSFAAYLKKPDGFIYDAQELETINGKQYNVWRPHNASEGTFQGYEFNAQGFFSFLPGKFANLGGQFNYSYNQVAKIDYPGDDDNAIGNSKYTYNAILYYDTPQLSARIAYNFRDRYRAWTHWLPQYSPYVEATSRLDAAVNWTPIKQLTLSVEGTNLLQNNTQMTWGVDNLLPQGIRVQARTIQLSARFRY
ncbi:TonB-dependent receptor [Asticcacaulis sp. AC460]|uniref:TonB-dependent receptor n=1 Tax=Asticcacaulis sp. AC460 TaxID=1282360 RepID=UPI001F22DBA0|nr:TonB-dependent receptor [Asticcacaulis sp. AC460]